MTTIDMLGLAAAFCTTVSFLPQAIKVVRTRDTEALSLGMYAFFSLGVALWLAYGLIKADIAISIANSITLVLALVILGVKIKNDRFNAS